MSWSAAEFDADAVLVIGYGNRLRGDDGAGPAVAEAVARQWPGVRTLVCHQLLPELAATISDCRVLVLVDACADAPPGEVTWRAVTAQASQLGATPVHAFDAAGLLALSAGLFGAAPRALLATIGGRAWDRPDELSPPVRRAVGQVCRELPQRVAAALESDGVAADARVLDRGSDL